MYIYCQGSNETKKTREKEEEPAPKRREEGKEGTHFTCFTGTKVQKQEQPAPKRREEGKEGTHFYHSLYLLYWYIRKKN